MEPNFVPRADDTILEAASNSQTPKSNETKLANRLGRRRSGGSEFPMIMPASPPDPHVALQRYVTALLAADWTDPAGPLRLNDNLAPSQLAHAPFFLNVRSLLRTLDADGGTPATATGNLNRAFVWRMFERMAMHDDYRESFRHHYKALNEQELNPLHLVRIVCECGRLIAKRNKRFTITRRGRELLPDDQAGALYRHLFVAHFREFNLGYRFHLRDVAGIQETMAVILWRLAHVARDWTPVQGLAEQVLIPPVFAQLRAAQTHPMDTDEWILAGYALNPLLDFGLIEKQPAGDLPRSGRGWPGCDDKDHIRVTALFHRFLSFPDEP